MKKQRILIMGGAGYIGSATTRALLASVFEPVVIDKHIPLFWKKRFPGVQGFNKNLLEKDGLGLIFSHVMPAAVIHLAAEVAHPESNVQITKNIIQVMRKFNCTRLVFASSAAVYGNAKKGSKETDVLHPINPYGVSKVACEKIVKNAAILRYFNVCGKSESSLPGWSNTGDDGLFASVYNAFSKKDHQIKIRGCALPTKDGTAVRDWVHISDVVRANIMALGLVLEKKHGVFNIASGQSYSVGDVLTIWEKLTGITFTRMCVAPRKSEIVSSWADIQKAREKLMWHPKSSLLSSMIKSYIIK